MELIKQKTLDLLEASDYPTLAYPNFPKQTEIQKWLRDIYNIDVQPYLVECVSNNRLIKQSLGQKEYSYKLYEEGIDIFVSHSINDFCSYEEALEKGLQEGLRLISK